MTAPPGATLLDSLLLHVSFADSRVEELAPFMDAITVQLEIDGAVVDEKKLMSLTWWVDRTSIFPTNNQLPKHLTFCLEANRPIREGQQIVAHINANGETCPVDIIVTAELRINGEIEIDDDSIPELPVC